MPIPKPGEKPLYSGTLDCIKRTIKLEGVKGLYKGMGAPLLGVAPIFAISFMGFGLGKKIFGPPADQKFTYLDYFKAGAFSGIFTTVIMAPGERIKCLLQIQQAGGQKLYNGPVDCVKKLYREGGIKSIYRGSGATLLRGKTFRKFLNWIRQKKMSKISSMIVCLHILICIVLFAPTLSSLENRNLKRILWKLGISLNWLV